MTTLLDALSAIAIAIERGNPFAMRKAAVTIPAAVEAQRVSGRNLSNSECAELFPITSATWEREPGQSDGDFVQTHRPWDWWLTLTFKDVVSKTYALSLLKEWARDLARESKTHLALAVGIELQDRDAPHFHIAMHVHQHADDFDARAAERSWRALSKMRKSDHRERPDRRIVNAGIGCSVVKKR